LLIIYNLELVYIDTNIDVDEEIIEKQKKALQFQQNLLQDVNDGDDSTIRDILLYKTSYYIRQSEEQNKAYFDRCWPGGFKDFISKKQYQNNKK